MIEVKMIRNRIGVATQIASSPNHLDHNHLDSSVAFRPACRDCRDSRDAAIRCVFWGPTTADSVCGLPSWERGRRPYVDQALLNLRGQKEAAWAFFTQAARENA